MTTKFFLYARKSSEAEERQVMSIEAQLHELTQFADREKLVVAETFIESKSAKIPGRKEFARMIEKINTSKEQVGILSWHPDRLARNSIDGGQIIYLIDQEKVSALRFPTFWFEPTPQGLFMLQVAFGQSKYYSDNLSENVKRGIRQKLRRGEYGRKAPLGYINNPKTRNIEPDPDKAKIVQSFYKDFSKGIYNLETGRHYLSTLGVECTGGNPYTPFMVYRILTNKTYLGLIEHKGEYFQGSFEPLIDRGTFESVQRVLTQRARPRKSKKMHDFPFRGLFKCGECGCRVTAQFAKGRHGGIYRYYRCTKKCGKCSQGYLMEKFVASQLQEQLNSIAISDDWRQKMFLQINLWEETERRGSAGFAQNLKTKTSQLKNKMDKLVSIYLDGEIEKDVYLRRKDALMKISADIHSQKNGFGQPLTWLEPLRQWVKTANHIGKLADSDSDYKDLSSALQKVGSNPILQDKKIVFDWLPPFDILAKDRELDTEKAKNPARAGFKKREEKNETSLLVRAEGLEPPCLAAPDPKSGMSTNSTTPALMRQSYKSFWMHEASKLFCFSENQNIICF